MQLYPGHRTRRRCAPSRRRATRFASERPAACVCVRHHTWSMRSDDAAVKRRTPLSWWRRLTAASKGVIAALSAVLVIAGVAEIGVKVNHAIFRRSALYSKLTQLRVNTE